MSKNNNVKKRHWGMVLYPESAPANWVDILVSTGLSFAVSPLHDKDVNPTGEPKKAHYHLILAYSGPTTFNSVKSITESLCQPIPIPLESVRGAYRYFTHMDNPEKFQYDPKDIRHFNGFDISDFIELTRAEVNFYIKSIQQFICDNNIFEYADLLDILLETDMSAEYDIAINHTYLLHTYISSRRNKFKNSEVK